MSAHRTLHDLYRAFDSVGPGRLEDPGNGGTITIDSENFGVMALTSTGAETRTLAAPNRPGIFFSVMMTVDGGDITFAVTGTYDGTNTNITFDQIEDWVTLFSVETAPGVFGWRVAASGGTALGLVRTISNLATTTLTVGGVAVTASAAELNQLDGNILADMTPGTGISTGTGTICEHSVQKIGGIYKTTILLDLTGLNSGDTDGDIIGKAGTANSHIGQILAAVNGTIFAGRMYCIETPAGGEPDIDLYAATEATGAEESAIGDLAESALLTAAADWAAGDTKILTAFPAANKYLYLVASGGVTNDTYTAGIFLIELWGK